MRRERMVCVVGFKAKARRGAGDGGACVEHMCTCTDTYTRMVWLKVKTNTESSYILVLVSFPSLSIINHSQATAQFSNMET